MNTRTIAGIVSGFLMGAAVFGVTPALAGEEPTEDPRPAPTAPPITDQEPYRWQALFGSCVDRQARLLRQVDRRDARIERLLRRIDRLQDRR